jgi:hypothetical protein
MSLDTELLIRSQIAETHREAAQRQLVRRATVVDGPTAETVHHPDARSCVFDCVATALAWPRALPPASPPQRPPASTRC